MAASVLSSLHAKIEGIRGTQRVQTFVFGTARGREAGFITPQGLWLALRAAPEELPRVRVAAKRNAAPPPAEPVDASCFITVAEPEPDPEDVPTSMMPVLEPEPKPPPLEQAPPHSLKPPYESEPPRPGPPPAPAPTPEPEREQELKLEKLEPEPEPEPTIPLLASQHPAAASIKTRPRLHRAAPRLGIEILFRDMGAYEPASNAPTSDLLRQYRRAQLLPKQLSFLGAAQPLPYRRLYRRSTFDARGILPSLHEPRYGSKMCLEAHGAARRRSTLVGRRVPPRYPQ